MAKGVTINIGLDYIDPKHYGTNGLLPYCVNDATAMRKLAVKEGYTVQDFLINEKATAANVIAALEKAAGNLYAGDKLLLTYSGHGGYFPDLNRDEEDNSEEDKYDETWILFDRMFIDDELYYAWSKFRKGVRILLISDSCHSGTMAKPLMLNQETDRLIKNPDKKALLEILKSEAEILYKKHKKQYDPHLKFVPRPGEIDIQASVILLASSQDDEISRGTSRSGRELSLFTDELLTVYSKKDGRLNYNSFLDRIKDRIPVNYAQNPNYYRTGAVNKKFFKQRPFEI